MSTTEPFMPAGEPLEPEAVESPDVEGDRDGAVDVLPDAQADTGQPLTDDPAAGADDPAFRTPTPGERLTADELQQQIGDDPEA
jgi:hypothetical protein